MTYIERSITSKLTELFEHFPVVALVGARQVGKTTLVERLPIPGLRTITFDPVQDILRVPTITHEGRLSAAFGCFSSLC